MNSPEQTQVNPEIVYLNQDFNLINPRRTNFQDLSSHVSGHAYSQIILESGRIPNFPLDIHIVGGMRRYYSKGFVLTPFNPEIGNHIVLEDLKAETRLKRLLEHKSEIEQWVDSPLASHLINVQSGTTLNSIRAMKILGADWEQHKFDFDPQYLDLLSRLRLLLSFPLGSYMARAHPVRLQTGAIVFSFYYPVETGPLPAIEEKIRELKFFIAEGFPLLVPFERPKLETIMGRFLLGDF